jgi:hypothetical protein
MNGLRQASVSSQQFCLYLTYPAAVTPTMDDAILVGELAQWLDGPARATESPSVGVGGAHGVDDESSSVRFCGIGVHGPDGV